MKTFHVKRGDEVVVISGSHKGKVGRILSVKASEQRALVEGVAMQKKHLRKSEQNPNGAIVERESAVHISNLMLKSRYESRRETRANRAATA